MTELLAWGSIAFSGLACGLSALSLGYSLATRRRAEAKARRVAEAISERRFADAWHRLDDLVRGLPSTATRRGRAAISIARTGGEPEMVDAA